MRTLLTLLILATTIALVSACGQKAEIEADAKPAASVEEEAKAALPQTFDSAAPNTETDKQSYSLGVNFGNYLKRALDENKRVDVELNVEWVMKGVDDALAGTQKMSEEDVMTAIKALEILARQKRFELDALNKAKELQAGALFMAENAKKPGVKSTESGLQYRVLEQGNGEAPGPLDHVKVHYHGTLIDGTEFDSSYSRDQPVVFRIDQVIRGWAEGLQLMRVGSKYSFVIPAELAYGERATGRIRPNSTLLFDVELLSIEKKGE